MKLFHDDFFGLQAAYPGHDGACRRRIYLDSAASTLAMKSAWRKREQLLEHYGSVHTVAGSASGICHRAFRFAQQTVLEFFGFPEEDYYCLFVGSGATAALNRAAYLLTRLSRPEEAVVLSLMEHHSNDLPHRAGERTVIHVDPDPQRGDIDLEALGSALALRRVAYVAVSACSNVTGVLNPIGRIAHLAHGHRARLLVDGSQLAVHERLSSAEGIDAFVFAGHKAYAPGAPGVLIIRKTLHDQAGPGELGGGVVRSVGREHFTLAEDAAGRLHPGTPDVLGAFQIAMVLKEIRRHGFNHLIAREQVLTARLLRGLTSLGRSVRIYGPLNPEARTGVVSFNLEGIPHEVVAWALDHFFAISVRNGCFCAQPYVKHLLGLPDDFTPPEPGRLPGMVRASLAAYSRESDVDALLCALRVIAENGSFYSGLWQRERSVGSLPAGGVPPVILEALFQ